MKYKYHKILFDLITKRVTLAQIRNAQEIDDIVTRIRTLKRIKFSQLKKLTYERFEEAIEIHNRYCTDRKILILDWLPIIVSVFKKIRVGIGGNGILVNTLVSGVIGGPQMALVARVIDNFIKTAKTKHKGMGL